MAIQLKAQVKSQRALEAPLCSPWSRSAMGDVATGKGAGLALNKHSWKRRKLQETRDKGQVRRLLL